MLTVVENIRAKKPEKLGDKLYIGTEKLIVDGVERSVPVVDSVNVKAQTEEMSISGARWAHLENVGGYYFPQGGDLYACRRTGASSFLEMWLNHGVSPQNETYAYVMLPNKTPEQTGAYAQNPDIEILSNTTSVQAVRENKLDITSMVFWKAGSFGGVKVSNPMMVMVKEEDGKRRVSVSDPTQKLGMETVTIDGIMELSEPYKGIETAHKDGQTILTVNFKGALGKTFELVLNKLDE